MSSPSGPGPSREQVLGLVERYVATVDAQDVDAAVACFAPDATQDDPVGEGHNVGHAEIRSFFEQSFSVAFDARLDGPVTAHASFAAFRFVIEIPAGRTPFRVQVVDLVEVALSPDGDPWFVTLKAVPDSRVLNA